MWNVNYVIEILIGSLRKLLIYFTLYHTENILSTFKLFVEFNNMIKPINLTCY